MQLPSYFARLTKRKPVLQPIFYPGAEVLRFFHYTSGSVKLVWHHHKELEIMLVLRGQGHHIAGDIARQYGPGDLVFLGSDLPHARYSVPAPSDHLEHIIIQFRPDFLGQDFLAADENSWLPVLFQKALPGLHVTEKTRDASEVLLRGMVSMSPADRLIELLMFCPRRNDLNG